MKKITREELNEVLEKHRKWLSGDGGEQADLSNADLSGADLYAVDLNVADLSGADLSGANLSFADLINTNLYNANLYNADLSDANLSNVDLTDADLRGVNLSDANLLDADLTGANLSHAYLTNCNTEYLKGKNIISVQVDTSRENNRISYWRDLDIWTTGCFQGSLEELKERIEETHKDNKFLYDRYQRAIEYILKEVEVEE